MSLVMLKRTSNPNFKYLEGRIGDLSFSSNGTFDFAFANSDGSVQHMISSVKGSVGDLNDARSKEVTISTQNSMYDFAKLENYIEESKVFSNTYRSSLDEKIDSAARRQEAMNNVSNNVLSGFGLKHDDTSR